MTFSNGRKEHNRYDFIVDGVEEKKGVSTVKWELFVEDSDYYEVFSFDLKYALHGEGGFRPTEFINVIPVKVNYAPEGRFYLISGINGKYVRLGGEPYELGNGVDFDADEEEYLPESRIKSAIIA